MEPERNALKHTPFIAERSLRPRSLFQTGTSRTLADFTPYDDQVTHVCELRPADDPDASKSPK